MVPFAYYSSCYLFCFMLLQCVTSAGRMSKSGQSACMPCLYKCVSISAGTMAKYDGQLKQQVINIFKRKNCMQGP